MMVEQEFNDDDEKNEQTDLIFNIDKSEFIQ